MAMLLRSLRARVIARGARNFRAYAELAVAYEERAWSSNGTANRVVRMPSGPAVVITPWNAPFMLSTWKAAPALAAGCTVVLKPAEWSPLSASLLADLAAPGRLPAGVLNVVQGIGEEAGAALVAHPRVRRMSLTGSPETGRAIGEAAARNLVPFTAELGGKGPLIVFADADLEAAAAKAAGQYDDAGQVCLAGTRLLVEESVARAVPGALPPRGRRARARRPARRRDDGLAADPPRPPRAGRRLRRARSRRRRRDRPRRQRAARGGLWYEPTLIGPGRTTSEIVQREVFGPVLTLQTLRGRGRGGRAGQLDRIRPLGGRLHGLDGSAPSGSGARSAPGPSG